MVNIEIMISRRGFLGSVAGTLVTLPGRTLSAASRPRIAVILSLYRPGSHADVWVTALLEGYDNGQPRAPRLEIVSMYTDQVPTNDMSRGMSAKHGFKIYSTIPDALTMGTGRLAVDGVLLMAEQGEYAVNEKGQILYPRYEFFRQIVDVYRQSHRVVPLFCDKHLSYDWTKAKWMYDQSRELKFPFMAGSSIPQTWRRPPLELDIGTPVEKAVVAAYGPKEPYGFHALEALQCMVERRAGGEKGIAAVQCLEGPDVWKWTESNDWSKPLLNSALERVENREPGTPQKNTPQPILFLLDYIDGLQGAVYLLNGYIKDWAFAAKVRGRNEIASTKFWSRMQKPWSHATGLTYQIEQLYLTRRTAFPVERTLLTTGALAALMDSSFDGDRRLETPHLKIAYRAPKKSVFNTGRIPAPVPS
jgi:hypothetical protein